VGFSGYPWGLIAYPMGNFLPLIQFVDTTGVWGMCFLMALLNALIAEYALAGPLSVHRIFCLRQAAFGLFLVVVVLGYGTYRLAMPIPHASTARLLLVQQNTDPWDEGSANNDSLKVNVDLTLKGLQGLNAAPDLAVWSKSSVTSVYVEHNQ